MKELYFTITGTNHYYGNEFFEPGMVVILEKDKDNEYDSEAIMVKVEGLGKVGYVANSPYTVMGESMSAGRLYDKIGDKDIAYVKYKLKDNQGILCCLEDKKATDEYDGLEAIFDNLDDVNDIDNIDNLDDLDDIEY